MGKAEISEFVRTMHAEDHAILFYADRRDKRELLFTYLKAGLDAGEAAVYVASDESAHEIGRAMEDFGMNPSQLERRHALRIVDYREWYMIGGNSTSARHSHCGRDLCEKLSPEDSGVYVSRGR